VAAQHEYERLKVATAKVIKASGIEDRQDFQHDYPAQYHHYGVLRHFKFDFSIGPTAQPYSLYHRTVLSHQKTFDSIILNFDWYKQSKHLDKRRLCALIVDDDEAKSADVQRWSENRSLLDQLANVVSVTDNTAPEQLRDISQFNGHV